MRFLKKQGIFIGRKEYNRVMVGGLERVVEDGRIVFEDGNDKALKDEHVIL